jgi:hypothetical protein
MGHVCSMAWLAKATASVRTAATQWMAFATKHVDSLSPLSLEALFQSRGRGAGAVDAAKAAHLSSTCPARMLQRGGSIACLLAAIALD